MNKNNISRLLIVAAFLTLMQAPAQAASFDIDPMYSTLNFRIKHLMGYAVGIFKTFKGSIELNEKNDALKSIDAVIDVTSVDTKNNLRDIDLRSEKFLDVEKFPEMKFVLKSVDGKQIKGALTMHGVTKEVVLDYEFSGVAQDQYGRTKTALSLKGKLNRKDFGIVFNFKTDDGTWLLGDDVELMIEVEGLLKK